MKKLIIALIVVFLLLIGIMIWLAGSVGPDTAPQETRTIELTLPNGN